MTEHERHLLFGDATVDQIPHRCHETGPDRVARARRRSASRPAGFRQVLQLQVALFKPIDRPVQLGHGELVRLPLDLKSLEVRFEERPLNLKGILNGIHALVYSPRGQLGHTAQQPEQQQKDDSDARTFRARKVLRS